MVNIFKKINIYVITVLTVVLSIMPLKVLAIDFDFYSANDILFYNPDSGCPANGTDSSTGGSGSSSQNTETTLKFFTGKGLSLAAAAGIAGNLKKESGIVPTRVQGTPASYIAPDNYVPVEGVGFGIAQWTSGGRQKNLVKFAEKQGKKITDLNMQLDSIWASSISSFKEMVKGLNSIKSETPYKGVEPTVAAAILFHGKTSKILQHPTVQKVNPPAGFEASGDTGDVVVNKRGKWATDIYKEYKGKIPDGTGVDGVGTDDSSGSTVDNGGCNNEAVSGDIVATALNFALSTPADNKNYSSADSYAQAKKDANPAYIEGLNKYNSGKNPADCGIYVATVMIASGADKDYPKAGTINQLPYLKKSTSKYKIIENPKRSDLVAGDILIVSNGVAHHTSIYTGGDKYPMVDASQDQRVPSNREEGGLTSILGKTGVIAARLIK